MTGSDRCMLCHHIILPVKGVSRPLGEGLQAPWTCCSRIRPGSESLGPAEMFIGPCGVLSAQRGRSGAVGDDGWHYEGGAKLKYSNPSFFLVAFFFAVCLCSSGSSYMTWFIWILQLLAVFVLLIQLLTILPRGTLSLRTYIRIYLH